MSTVLNNVHEEHQHHEKGSVTIFYHIEGPDKFNNFMFTSNFTFPDFFHWCNFSLTQSEIPWLFPELEKISVPMTFLTRGNHVSYNQTCFNKLYIICLILSSSLTGFIHLGTYIKKICLPYLQIISLNFFFKIS